MDKVKDNYQSGLVSVVIPTCNRGELFYKAIESVLGQTYPQVEIIVIDDNSDSPPALEQYQAQPMPIIYHKNDSNLGGAISRNIGAALGHGEFVCFLDDDDVYLENKLALLVAELEQDAGIDAVFGKIVKLSDPKREYAIDFVDSKSILNSLESIKYLHTNTSLIRHTVFDRIRFDEALAKFQDTQLHIELVQKCRCKYLDIPVALWNDNHGSGQITDMKNAAQHVRSIDNYTKLKNNLYQRDSISWLQYQKMAFNLSKMKVKYALNFGRSQDLQLNLFETNVLSLLKFRRALFCK
ncbi:glycosyltransferase family 2 protein [Vibrio tritonius]|uniref:Glycosyltransferase family 2 protein n=1 Tax=Vibrio tritonius TaxID=1435069 RepID=A0ABS7YPE6_9VIBR|nr:glycosyltransferase family 2 protein [Vibrio tritonius]MCA2017549.1 glycosyltransferase family 2 protein [Vibrio tritonius]